MIITTDKAEREIEVTVTVALHKTFNIKVSDYTIIDEGKDEDGEFFQDVDYSTCDLVSAVEDQVDLSNVSKYNGWTEDEFEVTID